MPSSLLACTLLLAGCGGLAAAPHAAPDPALAQRITQLSGHPTCSDAIAGTLTAYHIPASRITSVTRLVSVVGNHAFYDQNWAEAWLALADHGGHIVVDYSPNTCWIGHVYARDGATLPTAG
jgi:hypothetical protein